MIGMEPTIEACSRLDEEQRLMNSHELPEYMPTGSPHESQLKIEALADGASPSVVDDGHENEKSSSIKY